MTPQEKHRALEELITDYLRSKGTTLEEVAGRTVYELVRWSHSQLNENAFHPLRALIIIEEKQPAGVRVRADGADIPSDHPVGDMLGFLMDRARSR